MTSGTDRVHVHTAFRKSTFSEGGSDCVEVAKVEVVAMRDSKDPDGPVLWFTGKEWRAFSDGMLAGEFDDIG